MDNKTVIGALHRAELLHRLQLHRVVRETGLYGGQLPLLDYVAEHPGRTQAEIAEALSVSAASVACSAKRMEKAGFIARESDEKDLRRNIITATEKGVSTLESTKAAFDALAERAFTGFDEGDKEAFHGYIMRMVNNISDEYAGANMFELIGKLKEGGDARK